MMCVFASEDYVCVYVCVCWYLNLLYINFILFMLSFFDLDTKDWRDFWFAHRVPLKGFSHRSHPQ